VCEPISIKSTARLVLITGNPGGGKTVVAKMLGCRLPEPWEVIHLDQFLYLKTVDTGNFWNDVEVACSIRALAIKYYCDRGGRVICEGIVQTDREVDAYCSAANVARDSSEFRFFDLRCSRDEAIRRMKRRPLKESASFPFGQQFDGLTSRLQATGAVRIPTDDKTPDVVMGELVDLINGEPTRP
jgi:chloramphenicol 3-O-phosphotransferase